MAHSKIVLDTNVAIRLLHSPVARKLLSNLADKNDIIVDKHLMDECERILIARFRTTKQKSKSLTRFYIRHCKIFYTQPTPARSGIRDPNDEPIVNLCQQSVIDYIVSDDLDFNSDILRPTKLLRFQQIQELL
jgi:predicted nucleic acid-binding protein